MINFPVVRLTITVQLCGVCEAFYFFLKWKARLVFVKVVLGLHTCGGPRGPVAKRGRGGEKQDVEGRGVAQGLVES
jgi:hypothetical protein